jgi:D-amino peptidase
MARVTRILISADMEGISGVVHPAETNPGQYDYERGRALMTAEVNAVIAGVLDADAGAQIRVADAHGPFRNILPEELDRRAHLVRGKPRTWGMLGGLDEHTDAVLLVGYHARAGNGPAVLAHTMNDGMLGVRVNGREVGEIGLNAAIAGHFGVPVVMLSGDGVACAELLELVPGAVTVPVKEALGQAAAITLHPAEAREKLREAAAEAVTGRGSAEPFVVVGAVDLEVCLYRPIALDLLTLIPGVKRGAGNTCHFQATDYAEAYRLLLLIAQLATFTPA